eukprot:TRINITY_DN5564_c0_g1_i4.p1 TRINITY_DN5564_c0_g1~~TRINITY_DN5564_c0_g1_i4.p1  ORF type:complete len:420 (+),score=82.54 TRINITY_DN5564_c0_g1_i4:188-1447(+)
MWRASLRQTLRRTPGKMPMAPHAIALATHGARSLQALCQAPIASRASQLVSELGCVRHASTTVVVPSMGDSISEGSVAALLKSPGDLVAEDEVIVQIETDKVTIDVPAPTSGTITAFSCAEDDTVEVGADLFQMEAGPGPDASAASAPADAPAAEPTPAPAAAPTQAAAAPKAAAAPAPESAPKPGSRSTFRVPLTRLEMRAHERLKESQNTAAMLTTFNEINMHEFMSVRTQYKDMFEAKHGVQFGFMSAFVKAVTCALKSEPSVNSSIVGNEQVFYEHADIGIATATQQGLVVPVLRDAHSMSFADTENAITELGTKARDGTMAIEDMAGATFTIANAGVFGALMGQPMLNAPQSAVLGMHGITQRPVFVDNEVKLQPMMYVALTYDHRIIDGREAVTFLKHVKEQIEDPRRMVLDL